MEEAFACCPSLALASDSGLYLRWPHQDASESLHQSTQDAWIDAALDVMQEYTERTDGSHCDRSDNSVSWYFGRCDYEFGTMQAKELQNHLGVILLPFGVTILRTRNRVTVSMVACVVGLTHRRCGPTTSRRRPPSSASSSAT